MDASEGWDTFVEEYDYLSDEIYGDLVSESNLFDTDDGIHAKITQDGVLGLLLVFEPEEAEGLLAAFYAGMEGVDEAAETFAMWTASLMGMLRRCMAGWDEED